MALTDTQYNNILHRLRALEETVNDLVVAVDRLASLEQVTELSVLFQTAQEDVELRVSTLEERVEFLESEPLS